MFAGGEVAGCWARFRPSAGGSDKSGSTYHCAVSFVMLGNLSNTASIQKMATFKHVLLQQWTALNPNVRMPLKADI